MHTSTNYFLFSLALADLTILLVGRFLSFVLVLFLHYLACGQVFISSLSCSWVGFCVLCLSVGSFLFPNYLARARGQVFSFVLVCGWVFISSLSCLWVDFCVCPCLQVGFYFLTILPVSRFLSFVLVCGQVFISSLSCSWVGFCVLSLSVGTQVFISSLSCSWVGFYLLSLSWKASNDFGLLFLHLHFIAKLRPEAEQHYLPLLFVIRPAW